MKLGTVAQVLVAVAVASTAVAIAGPASADPRLGLSLDGVTWVEDVTTPLLDPELVWVPGDSEVATLYFRNQSGQTTNGYAEVTIGPDDPVLAAALTVRTRYDGGAWTAGTTGPTIAVTDGQVVRLDIEVTFDPAAGNDTMQREVPLVARVLLRGGEVVGAAGQQPPSSEPPTPEPAGATARPLLPRTGIELVRLVAAFGVLAVAGAWLTSRRRARRDA